MMQVLLVALGGAAGSVARYGVGYLFARTLGVGYPWGTLFVNIAGGLAMGVLTAKLDPSHEDLRLLIGVGVLGGFTTFSTFSIETVHLLERSAGLGLLYAAASVFLSVAACWAGFALVRS